MKKADIGVAAYVLAAFIMMIVPIPSGLLDRSEEHTSELQSQR